MSATASRRRLAVSAEPLPAGRPPLSATAVRIGGIVAALLLSALGIVLLQDALARSGMLDATSWLRRATGYLDGYTTGGWMLPAGIVTALVGAWVLYHAIRPRPNTAAAVGDHGLYLSRRALATIARDAANEVDGVTHVSSRASERRIQLGVTSTGTEGVSFDVREAVQNRLAGISRMPRVDVTVRREGA